MNPLLIGASVYLKASAPIGRRGFKKFMSLANKIFPAQSVERHLVSFADGQSFGFQTGDPYWLYYVLSGEPYEPKITQLLARVPTPALFLDCGANFGYWSVSNALRMRTVAVEASSETFTWLKMNLEDNACAFEVLHAAITDGSEKFVSFSVGGNSAGRHISDQAENVETIAATTVDALVEKYFAGGGNGPILVKLDVEGFEIAAFEGAKETLKGNSIFVYEEHGRDSTCAPTEYLLHSGRRVFFIDPGGAVHRVSSLQEVHKVKTKPYIGYNFVVLGDDADEI